uniref:Uncharacterized protein n=1 Tax=Rhodnius prolixus TaxID=13249 RepID=T1HRU8_RHOPR
MNGKSPKVTRGQWLASGELPHTSGSSIIRREPDGGGLEVNWLKVIVPVDSYYLVLLTLKLNQDYGRMYSYLLAKFLHFFLLATESLIARFKKEKTPVVLLQQITSLQQNPSETLEAFADRIKHISTSLLFKAQQNPLQTLQNLVEKLTTDAFIKSLPSAMKAQVQIKLPKNLDEAQTYATALRDIQSAEPQGSIFAIKKADSPIQSSDKPPSPCKHCSGVHWNSECTQKFQVVKNKRSYTVFVGYGGIFAPRRNPIRDCYFFKDICLPVDIPA